MNGNGGVDRSNEELLGDFKRWLELMDQSGLVSDRSIARALGVNHKLIGGSRTGSAWRDRNAVRRMCYVLGEAFWRLTPEEIAAWSDAVARGERSTALEMVEAIESGSYVGDKSADGELGDGDDADNRGLADSNDSADSGDLADSDAADAADALRADGDGDESSDAGGVAAADGIGVAGSARGAGGISASDSIPAADSAGVADTASGMGGVTPADSVDVADGVGAGASADGVDMADAAIGSSAIDGVYADSAGADTAGDAALGDAAGDAAGGGDMASAGADSDAAPETAPDAAGYASGDAPAGTGIAEGGAGGAGGADAVGAPDADNAADASGAAGSAADGHSGADAADGGASAGVDGGVAADLAGDAPDAAAGAGDSAVGGAIGADAGGAASTGVDSVVAAADGDGDVVSGDAGADSAGAAAASEDAGAGDAAAPDNDAPVGDAADGEDAMLSDVSAVGRGSVRAAGAAPSGGARVVMRGRKRGPFGIFGRRRDVVAGGVSRAGDLGSVSGVSGVSRAGGAADAGSDDTAGGDGGATAAHSGDVGAGATASADATVAADGGADAATAAGATAAADGGADAGAGADAGVADAGVGARVDAGAGAGADLGADPGILDIRRRMEQWTKKADGDAAKAEWEAREDPEGEIAALRRAVEQADSVGVIAHCSAGPVLREIPGLSLEDARTAALMKIDGWTPTGGGDKPPGLYGDAPLLFHLGVECSYADEGARAVAFAPNLAYEDEVGYSAVRLRYGLTPYDRMARYFCEDYLARPKRAGFYRHSNRLPERPYPDSDWFFGCTGLPRPGGVWMPSIAEVAAFYYMVKEMIEGFVGTAGEESAYVEHLRLLLLECQYLLFDPDYWITMHYHQEGKSIGGSTRVFERQTLADQIRITDNALARLRRRRLRRRALRFAWRALSWPARALWRRLRGRGDADIPEDALGEVVGESAIPGWYWAERDRTRWYEPGVGALSEQGDGWLAQLPDAMAEVWGGVARPRVRSVPGLGERRYRHGKWRIPRKLS